MQDFTIVNKQLCYVESSFFLTLHEQKITLFLVRNTIWNNCRIGPPIFYSVPFTRHGCFLLVW